MTSVRLACDAMATRFEMILRGGNAVALRAAGEEALEEIQRLERLLSVYRPDSAVAAVNREAGRRPVRVPPELVELLREAVILSQATGGAFDVTVGPLLRLWGLMGGTGRVPTDPELDAARESVGAAWIELDPDASTVRFGHPGVMIDLGSLGKGYALDRAAALLRDAGVEHAFLHGGTSTALAWGQPDAVGDTPSPLVASAGPAGTPGDREEIRRWRVAVEPPRADLAAPPPGIEAAATPAPLAVLNLDGDALSVSAISGKGFVSGGTYFGHVLDPRSGRPVQGALLAAVILPSAAQSDALSTALLVRGSEMIEALRGSRAPIRGLVVERGGTAAGWRLSTLGLSPSECPQDGGVGASSR